LRRKRLSLAKRRHKELSQLCWSIIAAIFS
jgi:hypothetical protein